MPFSLLWYDLETFGRHPQWDRIAQFAAVRTNNRFEEIADPVVAYCRLTPDYVPNPDACLTHGIAPQVVQEKGLNERDFAALIYEQMVVPATCTVGYNNLRFDDEFIRALFYRNFYDPYRREYQDGNTRWDILDLMRMCRDLRPDGIEWVRDGDGVPRFTLEELAEANGITHEHAHDALSDVRATIGLARLVHRVNPSLFRYYFGLRNKSEARRRLNLQKMKPVLHTSRMFTSPSGCTSVVIPLSVAPENANEIIAYDLRHDPADWLDAPVGEIRRRVFSKATDLGPDERIPLKGIRLNRCPAVAPLKAITESRASELGIDLPVCLARAEEIRERKDIVQRIRAVYSERPVRHPQDPDLQIYSGDFFPDEDRIEFEQIRKASPEELAHAVPHLYDRRGPELLWRYRCRNFSDSLDEGERSSWRSVCASRILTPEPDGAVDIGTFHRDVQNRLSRVDTPARDKVILKRLLDYAEQLEREVLG